MTARFALPSGVFPHVLSIGAQTYHVSAQLGRGLVMLKWPDGNPAAARELWRDARVTSSGFARLTAFDGRVLVAYARDDFPRGVVVCHAETGEQAGAWRIAVNGIHVCCWGPGGLLAVQNASQRVLVGQWPDEPVDGPLSRPGAADGLSRFDGDRIVLKNEEREPEMVDPVWTQFGTAVVGKASMGGVAMRIGDKSGVLWPGEITEDPHVTEESSTGRFTVAYWTRGSQGALPLQVACDIGPEDLSPVETLPPLDRVPLLGRVFGLACYTFNDAESLGNLTLPIRPKALRPSPSMPVIATGDDERLVNDDALWALYSGEAQNDPCEQVIPRARALATRRNTSLDQYQDSFPMRDSVLDLLGPTDIRAPQLYRNPKESRAAYKTRIRDEYARVSRRGECCPTINIHRRYNADGPTLSVFEVVEGFIVAAECAAEQGWPGMRLFRVGTSDVPAEIIPYIERFKSGITGVPPARVLSRPNPPTPIPTPTPQPPAPIPTPIPTPEELAMMTPDEREKALKTAGPLAAKFWNISPAEGEQGCREYNDALRNSGGPEKGIEGDPTDWIVGAGCRAKGATLAERQAIADLTVRLRR